MSVLDAATAAQMAPVAGLTDGWMPIVYIVAIVVLGFVAVAALALIGSESKDRHKILAALGRAFWWIPEMSRSIFKTDGSD